MATEARETAGLIGSDKVEGTNVYDAKGEKMGSIERVMIEKHSGQVAYAVLSFGGFLGIGTDYYPIPWAFLSYDTGLGGTVPTSPSSSSKVRRSTRAIIGTGTIASVAARSTIITARRGADTDRSWAGRPTRAGLPLLCRGSLRNGMVIRSLPSLFPDRGTPLLQRKSMDCPPSLILRRMEAAFSHMERNVSQ